MAMKIKLDIGCGRHKRTGYIGVDKFAIVSPDVVCDIENEKLPYEESSVSEIYSSQVFEHISDLDSVMHECHRVLHAGGVLEVIVPYWSSEGAFRDPTHVRFFSEKSFEYWKPESECAYYASSSPFRVENVKYNVHPSLFVKAAYKIFGIRLLKAFNNTIVSVEFRLRPIKA